ncbi:MAG: RtcB family protein [Oscillospiraceae bacterium]
MFTYYNQDEQKYPIKVWLESIQDVEENCLAQAINLSKLPFVYKWVALMPDTHAGKGIPIGSVIACDNVVIPNAVGVDIGCGMAFVETNIPVKVLRETITGSGELIKLIVGNILRNVPVGFNHFKKPQPSKVLDLAKEQIEKYSKDIELLPQIDDGYYQVGTLGGGNHFIEIQEDENGMACIMLHSGSRHFGNIVGEHFNNIARELNRKYYSSIPEEYNLPFLPVDTDEGQRYLNYMKLSMDFAHENRERILTTIKDIFTTSVEKYVGITPTYMNQINCHHNYSQLESHFDKNVWVHRKGAVRVLKDELAIIPGAMGSYSYIVKGKGNPDSFNSSSHGAGRKYSRKGALEKFSTEKVIVDLKNQGVVLAKPKKDDVAEECRFAYKDIETVMNNQLDLVEPIKKLSTVGVIKG